VDAVPIAQLQAYDPVPHTLHVQPLYGFHLLDCEGRHQDPAALEGEVQVLLELVEHDGSGHLQSAF
jgi:hypothetical protein